MADFDLSLVIRGRDEGATETGLRVATSLDNVTAAEKRAADEATRLANATGKTTQTAAEAARQAKANAAALNEVVRATNPAVGSQQQLEAAVRRVQNAYISGKVSAEAYSRAQTIAARATAENVEWNQRLGKSMGQTRMGTMMLGQQIQDVGMQLSLGTGFMRTFAMQAGQTALAVQQMTGGANKFASFIGGIWGSLLLAGVSVLAMLVTTLGEAKDEAEEAAKKTDIHKMSIKDLIEAIKEEEKVLAKAIMTGREGEQASLDAAAAKKAEVVIRRQNIVALLEEAKALQTIHENRAAFGEQAESDIAFRAALEGRAKIADLEKQITAANAALAIAQRNVETARIPLLQRMSDARTDPAKGVTQRYEDTVAAANKQLLAQIAAGADREKAEAAYSKSLDEAARQRERETKALQADRRKPRDVSLGDQISTEAGATLFSSAEAFRGKGVRSGRSEISALIGFNPQEMAWCAAFLNGLLKAQGISGTGSNMARSFLQWGTATDRPQRGDVVVSRRGKDEALGHVGLFQGLDPKGNVRVLGGNTGGKVETMTVARRDVLGFRRAPTEAAQFKASEAAAKKLADEVERLERFGASAADKIGAINSAFDDSPRLIDRAAKATDDLDEIIAELEKRKPPNFKELIEDARRAKAVVEQGLNKPFDDFIKQQAESFQIQQLMTAGREDEADALRIILDLEKEMGPLTPARKDAVLATVQALKAEQKELDVLREKQQKYLDALGEVKSLFQDVLRDPFETIKDLPKRLITAAGNLKADEIFESLFGDTFRQLEDEITGANTAKDAAAKMAAAVDTVTIQTDRTTEALGQLEQAAASAAGAVAGGMGGDGLPASAFDAAFRDMIGGLVDPIGGTVLAPTGSSSSGRKPGFGGWIESLSKGVGISDEAASKIGKFAGKGIQGAATGVFTNSILAPLGKALGFKTSAMGAQIGGAIGSLLPIPGGDIIGSIIGSIVGGLFKKAKQTYADFGEGAPNTFELGGGDKFTSQANEAGGAVQDAVDQIASALGATVGQFALKIGVRNGEWMVDPTGEDSFKNGVKFGEDAEAALSFAIMDAIKDGAIKGLSAAVQKALMSSSDIDKALREALAVSELEDLIAGVGNSMSKEFRNFEKLAAERVRLAQKYGLDLLAVEKINAEQRSQLLENIIMSRIGGLTDFLNEMKFGDLFEGDAPTRRAALLQEIADVEAKAKAGDEGAADRLVDLYRRLIETSEEAFGTAGGELAADRAMAAAGVEAVIAMENDRIAAAQAAALAQQAALDTGNVLADETNQLIAQGNSYLSVIAGKLAPGVTVPPPNYQSTARAS